MTIKTRWVWKNAQNFTTPQNGYEKVICTVMCDVQAYDEEYVAPIGPKDDPTWHAPPQLMGSVSVRESFDAPEPKTKGFKPASKITEDDMIAWVKSAIGPAGVKAAEDAALANYAQLVQPPVEQFRPAQ
jgi:hypothetical protein